MEPLAEHVEKLHSLKDLISAYMHSFGRRTHSANRVLYIEERLSLGPRKTLFLVACSGRKFLAATSSDTIVSITEIGSVDEQRVEAI